MRPDPAGRGTCPLCPLDPPMIVVFKSDDFVLALADFIAVFKSDDIISG